MNRERRKVMLVDDNITNLTIGKNILSETYDVFTVPSGEKLFKILEKATPDIILLDVEMPDMDGYETIKRLKSDEASADIPVIFLTARSDTGSEVEGLALGALDYITKPFSPPLLIRRIDFHLRYIDRERELEVCRAEVASLKEQLRAGGRENSQQ